MAQTIKGSFRLDGITHTSPSVAQCGQNDKAWSTSDF
jgi:hypothetical protein